MSTDTEPMSTDRILVSEMTTAERLAYVEGNMDALTEKIAVMDQWYKTTIEAMEKFYGGKITNLEETLDSLEPTLLPRRLDRMESRVEDAYDTASGADSALDDAREEIRKMAREIEELQSDVRRLEN